MPSNFCHPLFASCDVDAAPVFLGPKVLFNNMQKFGLGCYHRFTHINDNQDSNRYKRQNIILNNV